MVVCNGGMEAVTVVLQSLLEQGDEVILPKPNWPNMKWAVALAGLGSLRKHRPCLRGGNPVELPLVDGILTAEAGYLGHSDHADW